MKEMEVGLHVSVQWDGSLIDAAVLTQTGQLCFDQASHTLMLTDWERRKSKPAEQITAELSEDSSFVYIPKTARVCLQQEDGRKRRGLSLRGKYLLRPGQKINYLYEHLNYCFHLISLPKLRRKAAPPRGMWLRALSLGIVLLLPQVSLAGGSKARILRGIRAQASKLKACYERALTQKPGVEGQVVVEFMVSRQGPVKWAKVVESTTEHLPLDSCVRKVVKQARFSKSRSGGDMRNIYTFNFYPEEDEK